MAVGGVDVRVENQLVRFVPPSPVNHDAVVSQLSGQKNGGIVIKSLEKPRATIIIDEEGRIVVHGTHRVEAARAAAKPNRHAYTTYPTNTPACSAAPSTQHSRKRQLF